MTFQNGTFHQPGAAGLLVPAAPDQMVPQADHAAVRAAEGLLRRAQWVAQDAGRRWVDCLKCSPLNLVNVPSENSLSYSRSPEVNKLVKVMDEKGKAKLNSEDLRLYIDSCCTEIMRIKEIKPDLHRQ